MKPRTDVTAFEFDTDYKELLDGILENGYSRIPIYKESFDKIEGILYIKDLLPHLDNDSPDWHDLLRDPYFVPENKKIDDLLREFQEMKMHLAIVVDEYGGTSGIVTLEDIIEEIVGDITDEYDEEEIQYSKLDNKTYIFEGKTPLMDMYRILDIDGEPFEEAKGESDTVAGFVIEVAGKIPIKNERIEFEHYIFTIDSADKRKVNRVKVTIGEKKEQEKVKENGKNNGITSLFLWSLMLGILLLSACEETYAPKPRGYFRIDLPTQHNYVQYDSLCPFTFEYNENAFIDPDPTSGAEPCWMNITYPQHNGQIHISYKKVEGNLRKYTEDARELAMKHTVKASAIQREAFRDDSSRVYGLVYNLEGNAASSMQFWITDSTTHYVRGALYFNVAPNPDSIAPVDEYIREDIRHLIETFRWKD